MFISFKAKAQLFRVELDDAKFAVYQKTVELMTKCFSPSLDRERRRVHNELSQPVLAILRDLFPEEPERELAAESRHIVTTFFDETPTGRSTVGLLLSSDLVR